jgi:hypothetical protein
MTSVYYSEQTIGFLEDSCEIRKLEICFWKLEVGNGK